VPELLLYSLRPILLFADTNVSGLILVIDASVLAKSIMGRRSISYFCLLFPMQAAVAYSKGEKSYASYLAEEVRLATL
jgi:hypothetical protein